jgi:hypothetical protein
MLGRCLDRGAAIAAVAVARKDLRVIDIRLAVYRNKALQ